MQMGFLSLLVSDLRPQGILKKMLMTNARLIPICMKDNSMTM